MPPAAATAADQFYKPFFLKLLHDPEGLSPVQLGDFAGVKHVAAWARRNGHDNDIAGRRGKVFDFDVDLRGVANAAADLLDFVGGGRRNGLNLARRLVRDAHDEMATAGVADANRIFRNFLAAEERGLELDALGFAVGNAALEFGESHGRGNDE